MFGFAKGKPDEDRLTGAVFGLMAHLPPQEFLFPFIKTLANRSGRTGIGKRPGRLAWDAETPPDSWKVEPWPMLEIPPSMRARVRAKGKQKSTLEPDTLIRLTWAGDGGRRPPRDVLIYVEAEYSKVVEAEQLAQQWAVIRDVTPAEQEPWLLLVNSTPRLPWPDESRPDLWDGADRSLGRRDLTQWVTLRANYIDTGDPESAPPPSASLLHSSWSEIADIVALRARQSYPYASLYAALLGYLSDAGQGPWPRASDVTALNLPGVLPERPWSPS